MILILRLLAIAAVLAEARPLIRTLRLRSEPAYAAYAAFMDFRTCKIGLAISD